MAVYTGTQSVLNAFLGDYQGKGFSLTFVNDHIVTLYFKDHKVGSFSSDGMTIPSLHETCRKYLIKVTCSFDPQAQCNVPQGMCTKIDCPVYINRH